MIIEKNIGYFDIDIGKHIKELSKIARKYGLVNRNWLIQTIFWSDTDYRIELTSSWGNKQDVISYKKSNDEYMYQIRSKIKQSWFTESNVKLTKDGTKISI